MQVQVVQGRGRKIAPNLLRRDFNASEPLEKLATDVTEFAMCGAKVCLSPVMDLYNNEILSHSIFLSPNFAQDAGYAEWLFERLPQSAMSVLHFDKGWQYQMREHGIAQSMPGWATALTSPRWRASSGD